MKTRPASALLFPLLLLASADARHAQIYTSNTLTQPWTESISFSTFRAVLAQRLGVAQYHSLDDTSDDAIRALNAFQAPQKTLFSGDDDASSRQQQQTVVVVEDVDFVDDLAGASKDSMTFTLPTPPSMKSTKQFLADLLDQYQDAHADKAQSCGGASVSTAMKNELFSAVDFDTAEDYGCLSVLHGKLSEKARRNGLGRAGEHVPGADAGRYIVHALKDRASRTKDALILVLVEPQHSSIFKRSESGSWGTYAKPKRETQKKPDTDVDTEDGQYRPVVKSSSTSSDASSKSTSSSAASPTSSRPANDTRPSQPTTPPRGILPVCYDSKTACEDTTHACSGHGACKLKYDLSGSAGAARRADGAGGRCWACACEAEVRGEGLARRTTGWGGPACQKRDVSEPFWLLAGVTVGIMGVVAWAIGLLVSMGGQELPSVIGAGVAGPRAK